MQQEDQRSRDEAAAQDYMADMVADSLPVSVLPLLERLLEDDSTPAAIRVALHFILQARIHYRKPRSLQCA